MNGVINIIKPPGFSSHDLVNIVRRTADMKKVGHTGTLDPMAVGVLPVCLGKATKIVDFIQDDIKHYRCEMKFGIETNTQDVWGEVINESDIIPDIVSVEKAIKSFIGEISQVPPMYSALKINGQKLYNLAREGKVVERKARKKTIYSFDIVKYEEGVLLFDVRCSKGTYVRTLCHDLGKKLDSYGVMTFLERVATGSFNLENGVMLQDLRKHGKDFLIENLVSIEDAISSFAKVVVGKELLDKIKHGVRINYVKYLKEKPLEGQRFRIYVEDVFVGIGQYNIETDKLLLTKLFI